MEHNQYNSRLIKSHYNGDIRRFCLSKDCSFEDFKKSLHYLYGSISSSYCYRYMDDEDDMITITSNKELTEALRFSNQHNDTLKVFITEKKDATTEKVEEKVLDVNKTLAEVEDDAAVEEEVAPVNHDAYCDHCGEDIFGVRYKCANCEDYDLCENCEALWSYELSIHQEDHVFFKIYSPLPSWYSGSKLLFLNLYDDCELGKVENADETPESDKEIENYKNDDDSSSSDSDDETSSSDDDSSSSDDDDDESSTDSDDDSETSTDSDDDSSSSSSDDEKQGNDDKEDLFSLELQQALTEMDDFATKLQKRYLSALTNDTSDGTESSSSDNDTDSDDDDICNDEKPTEPAASEELQQPAKDAIPQPEEPVVNNANKQAKGELSNLFKTVRWFFGLEVEWDSSWDELLARTEEMGFSDKEHFKQLILDSRGDLARAIHSHFEEK